MSNWKETNNALAKLFNLPKFTQKAVIVLRGDAPPVVRITQQIICDDDISQITERFYLLKDFSDEADTLTKHGRHHA